MTCPHKKAHAVFKYRRLWTKGAGSSEAHSKLEALTGIPVFLSFAQAHAILVTQGAFVHVVTAYNAVVCPLALFIICHLVLVVRMSKH